MRPIDHLVHAAAWAALLAFGPARARASLDRIAKKLRPLDLDQARRAYRGLRWGTCLSRSLAIAIRVPGAKVAIGTKAPATRELLDTSSSSRPLLEAHAWILVGGEAIGDPLDMVEIARF